MSDEWKTVPRKKCKAPIIECFTEKIKEADICSNLETLIKEIEKKICLISQIFNLNRYIDIFDKIKCCEAWGIGSMDNSIVSQYQFAFFIVLIRKLNITRACLFFDPVINQVDKDLINHFNIIPNGKTFSNEGHTLLFMPHCDRTLYEQLLWKRRDVCFISNFFSIYSMQHDNWDKILPMVKEKVFFLTETEYTGKKHHSQIPFEAFNDLAIIEIADREALTQILESLDNWCKHLA